MNSRYCFWLAFASAGLLGLLIWAGYNTLKYICPLSGRVWKSTEWLGIAVSEEVLNDGYFSYRFDRSYARSLTGDSPHVETLSHLRIIEGMISDRGFGRLMRLHRKMLGCPASRQRVQQLSALIECFRNRRAASEEVLLESVAALVRLPAEEVGVFNPRSFFSWGSQTNDRTTKTRTVCHKNQDGLKRRDESGKE